MKTLRVRSGKGRAKVSDHIELQTDHGKADLVVIRIGRPIHPVQKPLEEVGLAGSIAVGRLNGGNGHDIRNAFDGENRNEAALRLAFSCHQPASRILKPHQTEPRGVVHEGNGIGREFEGFSEVSRRWVHERDEGGLARGIVRFPQEGADSESLARFGTCQRH